MGEAQWLHVSSPSSSSIVTVADVELTSTKSGCAGPTETVNDSKSSTTLSSIVVMLNSNVNGDICGKMVRYMVPLSKSMSVKKKKQYGCMDVSGIKYCCTTSDLQSHCCLCTSSEKTHELPAHQLEELL